MRDGLSVGIFAGIAAAACVSFWLPCRAEDSGDSDEAKAAAEMKKDIGQIESTAIFGKLSLEPIEDGQPAPKFAGTLITAKEIYHIKLQFPGQRKSLVDFDKKDISLIGYLVDKGDQGKVLYFESVDIATGRSPGRQKRGGL